MSFFFNKNGFFDASTTSNKSSAELLNVAERMYKYGMGPNTSDYFDLGGAQQNQVQSLIDRLEDEFGNFGAPNLDYQIGSAKF